ncbi:hypothetical protein HO133_001049 [Letharia lupina]|uniref:Uncharacterized protein n=1 Tax=Letharia lupina TaxID=560253 RepID=A0A8H6CGK4_9LECA|nr:uncharacterized protein HO133_001049 [Letharia lupina]KAF6222998.1 hypothetical protein HO133_001049 [Letharia lupina]
MASPTREDLDLGSSNKGSTPSEPLDSITSATTFDLFSDFEESAQSFGELTLPELPSFTASTVNKKRDRDEYLASSSDAPLFSSDDLPASSAENYYGPRVKRQHRRPWYETDESWNTVTLPSSTKKPRMRGPFKRTHDSGVWLGSDASTENEDNDRQDAVRRVLRVMESGGSIDGDEELWHEDERELDLGDKVHSPCTQTLEEKLQQALVNRALQITEDPGGFEGPVFPYWQKQPGHLMGFHLVQQQAQKKVTLCVEQGGEAIDLSTMYMQQVRTPTLRPLRYHTRIVPKQGKGNRYQSLTPALRLYLSNNLLEEVPGEVFHLKNLEVLSLRSNNLTEILPTIGELNNLKELNLGSNQLNWLPWELLSLLHANLQKCMIYPNPFIRPVPSTWNHASSRELKSGEPCQQVASTRIAFLDITGASLRHWPPAPSSLPEHWPEPQADDEFLGPPPEERTKTPSLLELALRACKKSPQLSQLPFLIPQDCPEHLTQLLQTTWKLKEAGGKSCSVCGHEYIIPRTEWIEWWYCIPDQGFRGQLDNMLALHKMPVPLLRRGCSWACWEEDASPLIRGWSSATLPGGLKEERHVHGDVRTSPTRRTIPPSGRIRQ